MKFIVVVMKNYINIIKWFALKFQYPNKKIGTSLVLKSDLKGVGKNIILDFIAEHVIGIKHIRLIDNIETLLKILMQMLKHQLLLFLMKLEIEEVPIKMLTH